jgi:hypothetical protein
VFTKQNLELRIDLQKYFYSSASTLKSICIFNVSAKLMHFNYLTLFGLEIAFSKSNTVDCSYKKEFILTLLAFKGKGTNFERVDLL